MSESEKENAASDEGGQSGAGAKVKERPQAKTRVHPKPPGMMPPWKVLLHNDDVNGVDYVISTVMELAKLNEQDATLRTDEADRTGVALLLITHKERAELYRDQFKSKGLTVTIEAAE